MNSLMDAGLTWTVYYELVASSLIMSELRYYPFNFATMWDFFDACKGGTLPTYSFVEPRYFSISSEYLANDQHPSHEISQGELFIKEIYEAVRASPQWNQTALIITYDEHGGFYDHVPTPLNIPNPDGKVSISPNFDFKRLGIRVPTIIISPWIEKGTIVHAGEGPQPNSQYEHSSVSATLKKVLNLPSFLTERDKWASTFDHIFETRSAPREDCSTSLPSPYAFSAKKHNQITQPMHEFQQNLVNLANGLTGSKDDTSGLKSEGEGGLYVQEQMKKFLQNAKMELFKKSKSETKKHDNL